MKVRYILTLLMANISYAQEAGGIDFFRDILGKKGVILVVGGLVFFQIYKNAVKLFAWIEDQTYGTRDYILEKMELLHWELESHKITYILLFLSFGLGVIAFGVFALFSKFTTGFFIALILSFVGWKIPRPFMDKMVQMRIKKYQSQMVDGLNLLSNGIRAGLSMPQAIGMIVDELPKPISQEFNVVLQQQKIGVPLEEALENLVKRVPTQDNEMFVSSVNILRETGGNLAEVFDTITDVIRERVRLSQKIETYVAQGKFQGYTIFAMPFVLMMIFSSSNPETMAPLFNSTLGNIILIIAIGLDLIGLYVILKVVDIKV